MNKASKLTIFVFLLFELTILINCFQILWGGRWRELGLPALALITLFIPFLLNYIANRLQLRLPPGFSLISLVFIYLAQYFGEIKHFYQTFWWWDLLLHGLFGTLAVSFALYVLNLNLRQAKGISETRFRVFLSLLSLCFSICRKCSLGNL